MNTVSSTQLLNLLLNAGSGPDIELTAEPGGDASSILDGAFGGVLQPVQSEFVGQVDEPRDFPDLMQWQLASGETPSSAATDTETPPEEAPAIQTTDNGWPVSASSGEARQAIMTPTAAATPEPAADSRDDTDAAPPFWTLMLPGQGDDSAPLSAHRRELTVAASSPPATAASRSPRVAAGEGDADGAVLPSRRQMPAGDGTDLPVETVAAQAVAADAPRQPAPETAAAQESAPASALPLRADSGSDAARQDRQELVAESRDERLAPDREFRSTGGGESTPETARTDSGKPAASDKAEMPPGGPSHRSEVPAMDAPSQRSDVAPSAPTVVSTSPSADGGSQHGNDDLPAGLRSLHLSPRAGEASWGREVGDRVGFLLHHNLKQAEIRLDPPHLGKLDIQLHVQDDKAVVQIHTQTLQTRDLIDASLPRLRDALQDAGYSQVDVNVSQRDASNGQPGSESGQALAAAGNESEGMAESDLPLSPAMARHEMALTARLRGGVDYFA